MSLNDSLVEKTQESSKIKVMLVGHLENPKIECPRQLFDKNTECSVIPLAVKKASGVQKFRIPFKNLSSTTDTEIDFTFMKPKVSTSEDKTEKNLGDYIDFFCMPS